MKNNIIKIKSNFKKQLYRYPEINNKIEINNFFKLKKIVLINYEL